MKDKNIKKLLKNFLNGNNLNNEQINKILEEKTENKEIFKEKILKAINKYENESTTVIARIIEKQCKRESLNNIKKRREIMRKIILKYLTEENIEEQLKKEKIIYLILDNYSTHRSQFIKTIAKILNITLIYLPPYSPHLNPIEQLWRTMKNEIKKYYLKSLEHLEELTKNTFKYYINKNNFYDNWFKTFITKVS